MNNDDIQEAKVMYGSSRASLSSGTGVYVNIQFNKEGTKKFEEITKTYKQNTEEQNSSNETNTTNTTNTTSEESSENTQANETTNTTESNTENNTEETKQVKLTLDGEEIMTTGFDREINTGLLQLSYGQPTTDETQLSENAEKAGKVAQQLSNKTMPIKYSIKENKYIQSEISQERLQQEKIGVIIILVLVTIIFAIKFKTNGLLAGLSLAGFIALYTLIVRYTNTIISLEGLFGMFLVLIFNLVFTKKMLKYIEEKQEIKEATKQTYKEIYIKLIPILIMCIACCFAQWIPITSFGITIFWGITIMAIYNFLITRTLLKLKMGGTNNETK